MAGTAEQLDAPWVTDRLRVTPLMLLQRRLVVEMQ
jgi:hypothetical protein